MALRFADTHNMIAFLTKSDASEGFEQIIDFLNTSVIQYALMVNPTIYVSCIKQFWSSVSLKKTNDVVRLQALIDKRKVIITEDMVRQALRLDDADSIDCLPSEEIFAELARMGAKRTAWNEFSSSMASVVFCLATGGCIQTGGKFAKLDADEDVTLKEVDAKKDAEVQGRLEESQAHVYHLDLEHAQKVLSMQETDEAEPAEVEEVLEVVTAAKLMTEVVTTATTPITVAPVPKASAPRRRRGMIIQDPEEAATASLSVQLEVKSKDKGKRKEIEEEDGKRKSENLEQKVVKKQKINEDIEEFKTHLQIVPNDEDDVYTEATHLALKVPVVDYQIHTEHNKPYYKIIRVDGTHQLFLSFISMLRNFDKEYLEMPWKIFQERFESSESKSFLDDFLLNALKNRFEKPNVEANIWKNQRGGYGLAKVNSWKLLESCGVYIITFTTTKMILLVERRYPLTRFTLEQMLNNVRLEVKEESEVSLELLRFVRI
nr:hypothetical protein [Tanacetum cinerariifolium]